MLTSANAGNQLANLCGLQSLGKHSWPEALYLDVGRLNKLVDILNVDWQPFIVEDQRRV